MRRLNSVTALFSVSLLGAALALGACESGSSRHDSHDAGGGRAASGPEAAYPRGADGDEIVLYKWSSKHLVRYSMSKHLVTFETRQPQTFQYGFSARSGLYASGDSLAYGFRLLDASGREVHTIFQFDGARGLFPVARSATETIVSVIDYDDAGKIRGSRLARVDGGKLEIITELPASPLGGAILGDQLYFTVAAEGGQKTYDLMTLDRVSGEMVLVRSGLRQAQIYAASGKLLVDGKADDSGLSFPCEYDCATEDTGRWLFSLRPNQDRDLMLEVFSVASGRSVWSTVGDIVDYRLDGEDLTVYLNGEIVSQRLGDLS